MPYDLYGTYYASRRDAENAEMAQVAAIDADIAYRKVQDLERQMHYQGQQQDHETSVLVDQLQSRVSFLEMQLAKLTSVY